MINLIKTEWRLLLFGFLMTFWSCPGQTFFISLFSGAIRSDLGLSHSQFGAVYSVATLASAFVVIATGTLIDRIALPRFSAAVIASLAGATYLLSVSESLFMLVIALFLLRQFGQSLMMLTATTTLVRYLEKDKGKATALGSMGYVAGEAIMPSILIALIALMGWRYSLLTTAVTLLMFTLPLTLLLLRGHQARHQAYLETTLAKPNNPESINSVSDPSKSTHDDKRQRQWTRAEVIRDKRLYLLLPAFMSQTIFFTGFIFHQVFLTESKGWSLAIWGSLFLMYAIIAMVSKLVTGILIDKVGSLRLVPFVPLPMALGLLCLGLFSHLWAAVAFLALLGITTGIQTTISAPFWAELYGTLHLGSIKSLTSALGAFGSALAPFAMGWFIDNGTSIETLALASVAWILAAFSLALLGLSARFRPLR